MNQLQHYNFGQFCVSGTHTNSIWHKLPVFRRSAVFILLFIGRLGEIRVVLTQRSSRLHNFPGHISLPGGRANNGLESEWTTARREMEEEIGILSNNQLLNQQFGCEIQQINIMPSYISRTFLAVAPVIGFLNIIDEHKFSRMALKLNPGESSAVFSAPLRDFLYPVLASNRPKSSDIKDLSAGKESLVMGGCQECISHECYTAEWGGLPWTIRTFNFPQIVTGEPPWLNQIKNLSDSDESSDLAELAEEIREAQQQTKSNRKQNLSNWGRLGTRKDGDIRIYDVWGLTANILHDLAVVTYTKNDTNKNIKIGDEQLLEVLANHKFLTSKRSATEKKLINYHLGDDFGFDKILSNEEFSIFKRLYKI